MILKCEWRKCVKNGDFLVFNPKRNGFYIASNANYNRGQSYLDAEFEKQIAPLITIRGTQSVTIPIDGDYTNINTNNMLISTYGRNLNVTEQAAQAGKLLRVDYDPDDQTYSYIFKQKNITEEWRYTNFTRLRNRCAQSRTTDKLLNLDYLFTPEQYLRLYQDATQGKIDVEDSNSNIFQYKK